VCRREEDCSVHAEMGHAEVVTLGREAVAAPVG
jgi:hypothetical protein